MFPKRPAEVVDQFWSRSANITKLAKLCPDVQQCTRIMRNSGKYHPSAIFVKINKQIDDHEGRHGIQALLSEGKFRMANRAGQVGPIVRYAVRGHLCTVCFVVSNMAVWMPTNLNCWLKKPKAPHRHASWNMFLSGPSGWERRTCFYTAGGGAERRDISNNSRRAACGGAYAP